jgi:predicted small integral membrane protein
MVRHHRLMDVVAHLSSGVFFGAVLDPWTDYAGVFFLALATVLGVALFWEWIEPKFQRFFGDMDVGYEDTVGDVLAVVLGAALIMIIL